MFSRNLITFFTIGFMFKDISSISKKLSIGFCNSAFTAFSTMFANKTFSVMKTCMFRLCKNFHIFNSIINFISVKL